MRFGAMKSVITNTALFCYMTPFCLVELYRDCGCFDGGANRILRTVGTPLLGCTAQHLKHVVGRAVFLPVAKRLGRGAGHHCHLSPKFKRRVELCLYSPSGPLRSLLGCFFISLNDVEFETVIYFIAFLAVSPY